LPSHDNEEEKLNELKNVLLVGQPKKNMSRTYTGTLVPIARMVSALALTEVVNHKSMVLEPR